ncbi:MAG: PKD domain-containing protein, partial [Flavobacteriales bacterium]|nr:PKD domain-containing protein [Flavobacteriales bacterium]
MTKFLATSVFIGLFSLFSFSQDQPCNENTILAVPDVFVIEEADILSFQANVLDNDIINVDDFYVNPHGVPPCFVLSDDGIISISPNADPTFVLEECCGTHFFWYTLITEGFECQTEVEITINCDASKNDCSIIDLSTVIADGGAAGGEEPANCIPVCGGALTTITYPFDPQNVYEWTVIGGDIETQLYDNEIVVVWQVSANTGSVILEIINDSGSQTIIQCVEIGQPPIADFQNIGLACKGSDVQFNSLSTPINAGHFWDFGDGSTSTAVNPIHSYNDGGIYEIMLTVTTPLFNDSGEVVCCCSDIELGMIEITNTEGPTIECISTLCAGDSACYSTSSGCPTADYSWELFDADGNPLPFDGNGTDEICVQWGDGPFGTVNLQILGCSDICDEWTSVNIPIISENSTPIGPNVVCENEVATYSVPKWMDVIYSWQVVGAESFTTDGNQVSVVWGSAGVGYIEVFYESPFLQSVEGHAP